MSLNCKHRFLGKYFHSGRWCYVELYADNLQDAEIRCQKLNLELCRAGGKKAGKK